MSSTAASVCTAEWGTPLPDHFHHVLLSWGCPQQSRLCNGRDELKRFDLAAASSQVSPSLQGVVAGDVNEVTLEMQLGTNCVILAQKK